MFAAVLWRLRSEEPSKLTYRRLLVKIIGWPGIARLLLDRVPHKSRPAAEDGKLKERTIPVGSWPIQI
jgi:hypothetical protein